MTGVQTCALPICPPMLMWLCEVAGVEDMYIKRAIKNAHKGSAPYPSQCSNIRKIINWEMVENGPLKQKG